MHMHVLVRVTMCLLDTAVRRWVADRERCDMVAVHQVVTRRGEIVSQLFNKHGATAAWIGLAMLQAVFLVGHGHYIDFIFLIGRDHEVFIPHVAGFILCMHFRTCQNAQYIATHHGY